MVALLFFSMVLIGTLCVLAYRLAVYALPMMIGFEIARIAYLTGAGMIGAIPIGFIAGGIGLWPPLGTVRFGAITNGPHSHRIDVFTACRCSGVCPYIGDQREYCPIGALACDVLHPWWTSCRISGVRAVVGSSKQTSRLNRVAGQRLA